MNRKREFQQDREKLFEKTESNQISLFESFIQHIEKKWGWYALVVLGMLAVAKGWIYEAFSTCALWGTSFFYWYVGGLAELVEKPIMSLSILDIFGLLMRISIGFFIYTMVRGLCGAFSKDRSDEECS